MGDFQPDAQVKGCSTFNFIALICKRIFAISTFNAELMKYSIYNVNNELLITDNPSLSGDKDIFFYEPFDWNNFISLFNEKSLVLSTNNVDATFNQFKSYYKLIEAAGGLIVKQNHNGS
jgi:hypothetical protein